jgi:hypothetical protein
MLHNPNVKTKVRCRADVIQRLPRLVAHLVCESLGYFTPQAAANAIAYHTRAEPFSCEWYYDWASKRFASGNTQRADVRGTVVEVGKLAIENACRRRNRHRGPMADFKQAWALVQHVRQGGEEPAFASWF